MATHAPDEAFSPPATGSHPWCRAEYSFAGWVPNVSGHLSFNQVDPRGRQSTYNHQASLDQPRTVVAHRSRIAQDYPWFDSVVRLFRPQASQEFLLLAESGPAQTPFIKNGDVEEIPDPQGALYGWLVVLPADDDRTTRGNRKELLKRVNSAIAQALVRRADGTVIASERLALDVLHEIEAARPNVAAYAMRFALFRTGECRIWFNLDEFLGRDLSTALAIQDELITADRLPAQAYYFVKDLLHAHYHHDPSSDQILPLTRLTGGSATDQVRQDEVRWRYVSLRGLVRVVVELRQGRSLQGYKRALGILAYANAFQSVLVRAIRTPGGTKTFADDGDVIPYDFEPLTKSIEATDHTLESVTTSRLQLFAIMVGIILSGLALWAGAVQIQPDLCGTKDITCPKVGPGPIVSFVNTVVANPLGFIVSLAALGFFFFVAFFRGTGAIPYAERLVRFLKGLADALGTEASKWTKGSDVLGWLLSLVLLGSGAYYAVRLAYWLVPKTHVPPVSVQTQSALTGPWAQLQSFVGKPIGTSGLLTSSVVGQDLRNILGSDYYAHVAMLEQAPLKREGDFLHAVATPRAGGDGSYLIIDTRSRRIEAGLRQAGRLHRHRSPGAALAAPQEVRRFLGASMGLDADPVPVEAPRCDLDQTGLNGSTLQIRGALRAGAFCPFFIPLQTGQSLSFKPTSANGLYVGVVEDGQLKRFAPRYTARRSGPHQVRIGWIDYNAPRSEAERTRPFFVRLDIR